MPHRSQRSTAAPGAAGPAPEASRRLMSIDALRGFDMFWIVGGGAVARAVGGLGEDNPLGFIKTQLTHVEWAGFHFYDLIFPLFVFIAGVSAVFSLGKAREQGGRAQAARRLLVRGLLLYLVGVFYSGGISKGLDHVRWLGVLQRIALSYTGAGLLFLFLGPRMLAGALVSILLGYWAILAEVPFRDIRLEAASFTALAEKSGSTNAHQLYLTVQNETFGHYEPGYNVVNHFDFQHLPGHLYDTYYDPEGILSTLPAVGTCLLGMLAGLLLRKPDVAPGGKSVWLVTAGFLCISVGFLWGMHFPIVKKLWSSTFVLVAGGYSLILLGAFHYVVDILKLRAWCQPFVWVGTNALTIYLVNQVFSFKEVAARLVGLPVRSLFGWFAGVTGGQPETFASLAETSLGLVGLVLMFAFLRFLHRRQIFLRL